MLYDIDAFGFTYGYITKNWNVMSEEDIQCDHKLRQELACAKYDSWKRHNIIDLTEEYKTCSSSSSSFEGFCKEAYNKAKRKTGD